MRGRVCRQEFVLKFHKRVIKDCSKEETPNEVCVEKCTRSTIYQDTIFCHRNDTIDCGSENKTTVVQFNQTQAGENGMKISGAPKSATDKEEVVCHDNRVMPKNLLLSIEWL